MPSSKKTDERNELKIRLEELHDQLVKSSHVSAADKDMLGKMVMGVLQLEKVQGEEAQQDIAEVPSETIDHRGSAL